MGKNSRGQDRAVRQIKPGCQLIAIMSGKRDAFSRHVGTFRKSGLTIVWIGFCKLNPSCAGVTGR